MRSIYLALVALTAMTQVACSNGNSAERTVVHQPVTPFQVQRQPDFAVTRSFTGVVQPAQSSDVAFELGGTVEAVLVDEGDRVEAGDTLARLDTALLEVERRQLEAQIKETKSSLRLTLANLERQATLETDGYASRQRRDELVASRDATKAALQHLQAALDGNAVRLRKAALYAPFDGVVSERFVEAGASAAAGNPVLRILETGQLEAHIGVPRALASTLSVGDTVNLRVAGQTISGEVLAVGAELKAGSHAVMVRIGLPREVMTADGAALTGSVVELRLADAISEPGFVVPESALTASMRGLWRVYVLQAADDDLYRVEARDLQLRYSGEAQAFVTGGLRDGEQIVRDGVHKIVPGQRVRLSSAG